MKIISLSILCLFINVYLKASDTLKLELNPRIGYEISLNERNYFGLFPGITDFKSAYFYKFNNSIYVKISGNDTNYKFKVKQEIYDELQNVFIDYERYIEDDNNGKFSKPLNLHILKGYFEKTSHYSPLTPILNITLEDNSVLKGNVLYYDSSMIILYKIEKSLDFYFNKENFRLIPISQVYKISEIPFKVINGKSDIFKEYQNFLSDYALFRDDYDKLIYPPEVLDFIEDNSNNVIINNLFDSLLNERQYNKYYIGISYAMEFISLPFQVDETHLNNIGMLSNITSIDIGYKITRNFLIGLTIGMGLLEYNDYNKEINFYNYTEYSSILTKRGINFEYDYYSSKRYIFFPDQYYIDLNFSVGQLIVDPEYYRYGGNLVNYNSIENQIGYYSNCGAKIKNKFYNNFQLYFSTNLNYINIERKFKNIKNQTESINKESIFYISLKIGLGVEF